MVEEKESPGSDFVYFVSSLRHPHDSGSGTGRKPRGAKEVKYGSGALAGWIAPIIFLSGNFSFLCLTCIFPIHFFSSFPLHLSLLQRRSHTAGDEWRRRRRGDRSSIVKSFNVHSSPFFVDMDKLGKIQIPFQMLLLHTERPNASREKAVSRRTDLLLLFKDPLHIVR